MTASELREGSDPVLVSQDAKGWIVAVVIGLTTVILAALPWSLRQI